MRTFRRYYFLLHYLISGKHAYQVVFALIQSRISRTTVVNHALHHTIGIRIRYELRTKVLVDLLTRLQLR